MFLSLTSSFLSVSLSLSLLKRRFPTGLEFDGLFTHSIPLTHSSTPLYSLSLSLFFSLSVCLSLCCCLSPSFALFPSLHLVEVDCSLKPLLAVVQSDLEGVHTMMLRSGSAGLFRRESGCQGGEGVVDSSEMMGPSFDERLSLTARNVNEMESSQFHQFDFIPFLFLSVI